MAMLHPQDARAILLDANAYGIDYHALPSASVDRLLAEANLRKYRAPKHRNGSRARYWHAYLERRAAAAPFHDALDAANARHLATGRRAPY